LGLRSGRTGPASGRLVEGTQTLSSPESRRETSPDAPPLPAGGPGAGCRRRRVQAPGTRPHRPIEAACAALDGSRG